MNVQPRLQVVTFLPLNPVFDQVGFAGPNDGAMVDRLSLEPPVAVVSSRKKK
jgi:hypothetical protein